MSSDHREARRQAALLRLSTAIMASRDEDGVCRAVVDGLHDEAIGYAFLGMFLIDDSGDRVLRASVGWPDAPDDFRVHPGEGLSEQALLDGELHYTPDVRTSNRYTPSLATGSEVDVPLFIDDEIVGVLVVESGEPDAFGERDFDILTAAASQASIAIARARLLDSERRRADEHEALQATMTDLAAELDLSTLLQTVLERAVTLLGAGGGELAIYDAKADELVIVANDNIGTESGGMRMKLGEGAMGEVAQTHEPMILEDYRSWSGQSGQYDDVTACAVMAAPMLMRGRLVGSIGIIHTDPDLRFNEHDLELMTTFASQAAVAIENARLYSEAQRQRQYFETLVRTSPVAIVTLDSEGRIVGSNPAFEKLFGYTDEEIAQQRLDSLIAPERERSEAVSLTERAQARRVQAIRKRRRKDGSYVDVEIFGVPVIVDGEQVGALGQYHDITELLQARKAAERANETKSQFLANMSHELRTPLNSVIGFANILLKNKEGTLEERQMGFIERILVNGRHLLGLINEVLDLAKIESGRLEAEVTEVDLEELVNETILQLDGQVREKAIALRADVAPGLDAVETDRGKLKQVIINLVGNAIKFTDEGEVVIRVSALEDGVTPKSIAVVDSGIGIPRDRLGAIFEAFQQADSSTSRRFGGTGLGLTISRSICLLLGYDLVVDSDEGEGSTFTILLHGAAERPEDAPNGQRRPKADDAPVGSLSPLPADPVPTTPTVLIIDDEMDARVMLSHALTDFGCEVITADSAERGLEMARARKPQLITLDLLMPGMSGWEALKVLKEDPELAGIPVVVVSIEAGERQGELLGAVDMMSKPVEREDLLRVISRNLNPDGNRRILVVDDDIDVRAVLDEELSAAGYQVFQARNGLEALQQVERVRPATILLDLMMPVMDGHTFLQRLRERPEWVGLPVIIVTAKDLSRNDRIALEAASCGILQKGDVIEARLHEILRELLATTTAPERKQGESPVPAG